MKKNKTTSLLIENFYNFFQITIIYTIVLFLLMSVMLYLISATSKKDLQYNVKSEISTTLTDMTNHCDTITTTLSTSNELKEIATTNFDNVPDVDMYNLTIQHVRQLDLFSLNNSYINSCHVYFTQNDTVLNTYGFDSTHNQSKYFWYYDSILEDSLNNFIWSRKTDNYITVYRNLSSGNQTNGIVIISFKLNQLINTFDSLLKSSNTSFALCNDKNNELLVHTEDFKEEYIKLLNANENTNKFMKMKFHFDRYKIEAYDWTCIFVYDGFAIIKQTLGTTFFILSVTFILLMLISLSLSYKKAQKMYRPIKDIITYLQNSNNSNLENNILVSDYSEIKYIIENIQSGFLRNSHFEDISKKFNSLKQYSLQLQIQPHFIYNTLEMIYLESYELLGDNNTVSEMIYNLSEILIYSLKDPNKLVRIEDEINVSKSYLFIQSLRFQDSFDVEWDIDSIANDFLAPKIIIQPILENAINHGILPSRKKCIIKFSTSTDSDSVTFTIEDNGVGIDDKRLAEINATLAEIHSVNTQHIGITNVDMRIKLLFGTKYGCTVTSEKNKGTKVQIRIPKNYDRSSFLDNSDST